MAATAAILDFGFHWLQDKRLGRLIWFLCGSLGVTAARPTQPLRQPSWIWFPMIIWSTPVDWSDVLVPHWGSSIITMFHFPLNLIFRTPTDKHFLTNFKYF
jgi:hypothetical protein